MFNHRRGASHKCIHITLLSITKQQKSQNYDINTLVIIFNWDNVALHELEGHDVSCETSSLGQNLDVETDNLETSLLGQNLDILFCADVHCQRSVVGK